LALVALGQRPQLLFKALMVGLLFLTPQRLMRLQGVLLLLVAAVVVLIQITEAYLEVLVAVQIIIVALAGLAYQAKEMLVAKVRRRLQLITAVVVVAVLVLLVCQKLKL
jgi:hypothetical protein